MRLARGQRWGCTCAPGPGARLGIVQWRVHTGRRRRLWPLLVVEVARRGGDKGATRCGFCAGGRALPAGQWGHKWLQLAMGWRGDREYESRPGCAQAYQSKDCCGDALAGLVCGGRSLSVGPVPWTAGHRVRLTGTGACGRTGAGACGRSSAGACGRTGAGTCGRLALVPNRLQGRPDGAGALLRAGGAVVIRRGCGAAPEAACCWGR